MNKTYIKRQLTLMDLDIPIDEDLKKYYIFFKENSTSEIEHYIYNIEGYHQVYRNIIFFCEKDVLGIYNEQMKSLVYFDNVLYSWFKSIVDKDKHDPINIFICFLETLLKVEINSLSFNK